MLRSGRGGGGVPQTHLILATRATSGFVDQARPGQPGSSRHKSALIGPDNCYASAMAPRTTGRSQGCWRIYSFLQPGGERTRLIAQLHVRSTKLPTIARR